MIREQIDEQYKIIKEAKEKIEKLQSECKHEKYEKKKYCWAPGHCDMRDICVECDQLKPIDYSKSW